VFIGPAPLLVALLAFGFDCDFVLLLFGVDRFFALDLL
jgi:hypothetical protein